VFLAIKVYHIFTMFETHHAEKCASILVLTM